MSEDTRGVGAKYDGGKAPVVRGLFQYFPRALKSVAEVSDYGFKKYKSWGGWRNVPDGEARYTDALGRHVLDAFIDEGARDPESGLLHAAHRAWNALAALELMLTAAEAPKTCEARSYFLTNTDNDREIFQCARCKASWDKGERPACEK